MQNKTTTSVISSREAIVLFKATIIRLFGPQSSVVLCKESKESVNESYYRSYRLLFVESLRVR